MKSSMPDSQNSDSSLTALLKPGRAVRYLWLMLPVALLALLLLLFPVQMAAATQGEIPLRSRDPIQQAWDQARDAGAYEFDADITQTRRPVASVLNVGRKAESDQFYLDGLTDISAQRLQMTMWLQGGAVGDGNSGSQIRVEGQQAFARQGTGAWEEIDNFTGLFAPGSDFMAYLVAAVNIENQGQNTQNGTNFTRLTFDIDGPAYARYLRDQMQKEMAKRGELPVGMKLGLPKSYTDMTGTGELWIGDDGLPMRQILKLDFAPTLDEQVSAEIIVNFRNFHPVSLGAGSDVSSTGGAITRVEPFAQVTPDISASSIPEEIAAVAENLATAATPWLVAILVAGSFTLLLIRSKRSRMFMAALQLILVLSMVLTPILNSAHAARVERIQQARDQAQADRAEESDMAKAVKSVLAENESQIRGTLPEIQNDAGLDSDGDGYTDVEEKFLGTNPFLGSAGRPGQTFSAVSSGTETPQEELPPNDGHDTDGDGLSDYIEALIGTSDDAPDTDGDTVSDGEEVFGFFFEGQTWNTDPLRIDSNNDGVGDGQEWNLGAVDGIPADTDGDLTPDLFDDDNDGDKVPDRLDLSPSTYMPNTFGADNPFKLVISDLVPDKITYVELQLRPTNPDHLLYAYHSVDWPDDNRGNIQDGNSSTDDVRLVPMLEVILPKASEALLPREALGQYRIMVQEMPDNELALYVPLYLATENRGAEKVAFNAKLVYNSAADWGAAHQVNMVWLVQANNDICSAFDSDGLCANYSAFDQPQIVHSYYDSWQLTGLNVRENWWSDVAVVFEDPELDDYPVDDTPIWELSYGLDHSFMAGGLVTDTVTGETRVWDVAEIEQRFNHRDNDDVSSTERWGIDDTFLVVTDRYAHLDEAIVTTVQTKTLQLLGAQYGNTGPIDANPTFLFARQDKYRSFNLDEAGAPDDGLVHWEGNALGLDIPSSDVKLEIASTLNWAPYRYDDGWQSYPITEYWDHLRAIIEGDMVAEFADPEAAAGAVVLAQIYYLVLFNGVFNIVQSGDLQLTQDYYGSDKLLSLRITSSVLNGAVKVIKLSLTHLGREATLYLRLVHSQVRDPKVFPAANAHKVVGNKLTKAIFAMSRVKQGLAMGALALIAVIIIVGVILLIYFAMSEEEAGPARITLSVLVGAVIVYVGIIMPVLQMKAFASLYQAAGLSTAASWSKAAKSADSVSRGAKIAAVIGLVIVIGLTIGIFLYGWLSSGKEFFSVEINMLLAQAYATIIVAVVQFFLAFTIVGAIVVAIIALIDILLLILGVDFSLNGWFAETLAKVIYHFELTVDQDISTGDPVMTLLNPDRGLEEGAILDFAMPVRTHLWHTSPEDPWGWMVIPYMAEYYSKSNLRETSIEFGLATSEETWETSRGATQRNSGWDQPNVRSHYAGYPLYETNNEVVPHTYITLKSGINEPLPVFLNMSYALPGVECWTVPSPLGVPPPICVHKTLKDSGSNYIGENITLDVMPDSLDKFMALDWGGSVPFPVQRDKDNDGLIARAHGGIDPDDDLWDTDGDGLSDAYEMRLRENGTNISAGNFDTDFDGLSDPDELVHGTDPGRRDTDRDGLDDSEEVWHFDAGSSRWEGGWLFTVNYTDTEGVPNQTLPIRIFSDPLASDGDADGISDGLEKALHELDPVAYPFHPASFNESPIGLYLAFSDADLIVGIGDSVTISATVQNNLSSELYARGLQGLTMPPELGGGHLTADFDLFQTESSTIITDVTVVAAAGATRPLTVTTDYAETRLHNGDLNWRFDWLPTRATSRAAEPGEQFFGISAATNPNPDPARYHKYAIASVEAPATTEYRYLLNGSANVRPAEALVQGRTKISQDNYDNYYGSKMGKESPGIACNAAGECLEAYVEVNWERCADVYFSSIYIQSYNDAGDYGEYYITENGTKFWGPTDGRTWDSLTIDQWRTYCGGPIEIWEDDDYPNADDHLGSENYDVYGPHQLYGLYDYDGDTVELWGYVDSIPNYRTAWRLLDSGLDPVGSGGMLGGIQPSDVPIGSPAVAASDTNWLVGFISTFPKYGRNLYDNGLSVQNISSTSGPGLRTRLDEQDDGLTDHSIDITWDGEHYLAVWQSDASIHDTDIKLAILNRDGTVVRQELVSEGAASEYEPHIAYSPYLEQALLVYASAGRIYGRIIENGDVGKAFLIASPGPSSFASYGSPRVAFDESNRVWFVSWVNQSLLSKSFGVTLLSRGTLVEGAAEIADPLSVPAGIEVDGLFGNLSYDLVCSHQEEPESENFRITSDCALVLAAGKAEIGLNTILMESSPPWLGGGGSLDKSLSEALILDNDTPTAETAYEQGQIVEATDHIIIGGTASDPTSNVSLVEVNTCLGYTSMSSGCTSILSSPGEFYEPAVGTNAWSYDLDLTKYDGLGWSNGLLLIEIRTTDVVGNVRAGEYSAIRLDREAPTITIDGESNPTLIAVEDGAGRWYVTFSGTADDFDNFDEWSPTTVAAVEAKISPMGDGWQAATVAPDGSWTLDYVLPEVDISGERIVNPTGAFTLTVRARDNAGNVTQDGDYNTKNFFLDATPPAATLTGYGPNLGLITETLTLTGVFTDPGSFSSGLALLEIDFMPTGQDVNAWTEVMTLTTGIPPALSTWEHRVPATLEGNYLINLRGTDDNGNQSEIGSWWSGWQGEIDVLAPRTQITITQKGNGAAKQYDIEATIYDRNLTEAGLEFPCAVQNKDRGYGDPFLDNVGGGLPRLNALHLDCRVNTLGPDNSVTLRVFDIYGHETIDTASLSFTAPDSGAGLQAVASTATASGAAGPPFIASTVLIPAHESTLTDPAPQLIEGGAYAIDGLKSLTMTVNGLVVYSTTWAAAPVVTDTLWSTNWTPPDEGIYDLVTIVEDQNGIRQTELQTTTVTVDTTIPNLTLDHATLTETHQLSAGRYELTGTATDNIGVESVMVSIDGGPAYPAEVSGSIWRYVWEPLIDPDGASYPILVQAEDGGNGATIDTTLTVDAVQPAISPATPGYSTGGAPIPIPASGTITDAAITDLTLTWPAATDGSGIAGYRVDWTPIPTPTIAALTDYPDNASQAFTPASQAGVYYGHVAALDTQGNVSVESIGPVYVDAPSTPDYISMADPLAGVYRGWMDSGCSLIGADYEVARYAPDGASLNEVQRFYLTWDATHLRMAWTGANWDGDGDLFIYLDTIGGGATEAYNPYGSGATIAMPDEGSGTLAADYLIYVEDGGNAWLISWDDTAKLWSLPGQKLSAEQFRSGRAGAVDTTDLAIPLSSLGGASSLKLVALASEEETLQLWAAMPDHNPLNSARAVNPIAGSLLDLPYGLTQHYSWTDVGMNGVCPSSGQFQDAALRFELTAEPAGVSLGFLTHDLPGLTPAGESLDGELDGVLDPALPLDTDPAMVGNGQLVTYTLHYANDGPADATGVVASLTRAGGLSALSPGSVVLGTSGTIAAGTSGSVTFQTTVDSSLDGQSAEVQVTISDSSHAPFDWLWSQHDIDSVGPDNVEITSPYEYLGPGENKIEGVVSDDSDVPDITLRIIPTTGGAAVTQSCPDLTPDDGEWSCVFDAGGYADGAVLDFSARGVDEWGNASDAYGSTVTLIVDKTPPTIALSAESSGFFDDSLLVGDEAVMKGTVSDNRLAIGVEVCALPFGETEPTCIERSVIPEDSNSGDWTAEVPMPGGGDGEIYTLFFYGIDGAGNRSSAPIVYEGIVVDASGPEILVETHEKILFEQADLVALAGSISDGSGVASLTLRRVKPDNFNLVAEEIALFDLGLGPDWHFSELFDRQGRWQFSLTAVDIHDNETILGVFNSQVVDGDFNLPPTAHPGGPYEVNESQSLTLNGAAEDPNTAVGQQIFSSWDLDDDGIFEIGDILDPVFDATEIDGPDLRTIALRVTDGEFTDTVTTTVSVRNLLPSADAGGPYELEEGFAHILSGTGTDPFAGDYISFTWDLDDDGVFDDVPVQVFLQTGVTNVPFDATLLDGPTSREIALLVTDDDGGATLSSTVITVTNVAPELRDLFSLPIPENAFLTLTGKIDEPAIADYFDMEVRWGDGRGTWTAIATTTAAEAGIPTRPFSDAGNRLLRLDADVFGEGGFQHRFENEAVDGWEYDDWSNYNALSFWYYGNGGGATVFVDIYDNRNPGLIVDDADRWRYEFEDDLAGWQQKTIPFAEFSRLESINNAPNDDLGLTEVWGWAIGTYETKGIESRFFDDFKVISDTTKLVDDFESGLPAGTDPNGIEIGFSNRQDNWAGTSYYSYPAATVAFTESHLYIDDDADDIYEVDLIITDDDGGFTKQRKLVEVYNVDPLVIYGPDTQSVQYSDYITPIVITVTDVISDPLVLTTTWKVEGGSPVNGTPLFADLSLTHDGCTNNLDYTQSCTWTISGIADVPEGDYEITAFVYDDDGGLTTNYIDITVFPEQATIEFDDDSPVAVQVSAPNSNASRPFELVVYVEELVPDLYTYAPAPGDITRAELSMILEPIGPGNAVAGECTPVLIDDVADNYDDILKVICAFEGVPVNTYSVNTTVYGGYYEGYAEEVLVVYDPSLGFTTGGGSFYWPGTADIATGYAGDKTSFGYNIQYNQHNLRNAKGSLMVVRHMPNGDRYRIRSNVIEGLSIGDTGAFGWASFSGKGTYLAPEVEFWDADLGQYVPKGNYTFLTYVEDHDEPGNGDDKFWIEVREPDNKGSEVIEGLSLDRPATAYGKSLVRGNIIVPHSGDTDNLPPEASFTFEIDELNSLEVDFTDWSTDTDGIIVDWEYYFGDGAYSTNPNATHIYAAGGVYEVTLTVTDEDGAYNAISKEVVVSGGNAIPLASFTHTAITLTLAFTDTSSDDGDIVGWIWDFGDGMTDTISSPVHKYAVPGTYDVVLTVTDDEGASDTLGKRIIVSDGVAGSEIYIDALTVDSDGDGNTWNAYVTARVLDDIGRPVPNAAVSGRWSKGFWATSSCTTNDSGECVLGQTGISYKTRHVTFYLEEITHVSLRHNPSLDEASSIRVYRPEATEAANQDIAIVIESTYSDDAIVNEAGMSAGFVDGDPVNEIPGASYRSAPSVESGRIDTFWLPADGLYTAKIYGKVDEYVDIQVLMPITAFSSNVVIFEDVHMLPGSVARLTFSRGEDALRLLLDQDDDGVMDASIDPTQVLEISHQSTFVKFLPILLRG